MSPRGYDFIFSCSTQYLMRERKFGYYINTSDKGAIYYVTITTVIYSRVKIWSFRAKAHLVFHWCFYNKQKQLIYAFTTIGPAGMAQWRERSPLPIWPGFNSGPVPYLGCVCCSLFLALLRGIFSKPNTPNSNSTRIEDLLRLMWPPL